MREGAWPGTLWLGRVGVSTHNDGDVKLREARKLARSRRLALVDPVRLSLSPQFSLPWHTMEGYDKGAGGSFILALS